MLCTVVRDVYRTHDAPAIHVALEELLSPLDSYGFASTGVYVFFDPQGLEVLYIGLARDLPTRFAQHHGFAGCPDSGCKRRKVRQHFVQHDTLGYAVIAQSPLDQSDVARLRRQVDAPSWIHDEENPHFGDISNEGLREAMELEGILIEAYRRVWNKFPPWNKTGGSTHGQRTATPDAYNWLNLAIGKEDSLFVARRTLRELATDPTAAAFEELLNGARMGATLRRLGRGTSGQDVLDALQIMRTGPFAGLLGQHDIIDRLNRSGYVRSAPPPPATPATPRI